MKQSPVLFSIIIVSYNTRELLEKCLDSVIKSLAGSNFKSNQEKILNQVQDEANRNRHSDSSDRHFDPAKGEAHRHPDNPPAGGQDLSLSLTQIPDQVRNDGFQVRHPDESQDLSAEIIVVDNHSHDNSVEMLENLKLKLENSMKIENLKLKIIVNNDNTGFAKANNQGIKKSRGKYVLFLNPDTIVLPETLPFMLEFMKKNPTVGVATCRVELVDGKLDEACHRGFPTPWNAFCHFSGLEKLFPHSRLFAGYYLGYLDLNTTHEIDSCVGAFMLVPRLVGEKIGWWDEDYFWYGEDIDFCYRVKKAGFKVMFVPKVKIIHYKGASSGIKKTKSKADFKTREKAMLASTQAMRIFYQKHYREKYPKPVEKLVFWGINLLEKARVRKIKKQNN